MIVGFFLLQLDDTRLLRLPLSLCLSALAIYLSRYFLVGSKSLELCATSH